MEKVSGRRLRQIATHICYCEAFSKVASERPKPIQTEAGRPSFCPAETGLMMLRLPLIAALTVGLGLAACSPAEPDSVVNVFFRAALRF